MNFLVWLIVGGVIGWVASILMGTNKQQGILLNVIVGIVGAFVGGLVLTPLFGIATINQNNFSMPGLMISLVGAVILLALFSLLRGGGLRRR
ncbi:MAG: GlsB/YeaQ/YmgE family stress response membrane protein [Anaerolineaceae bacterium]|nr:GlsB/YeaQ/YmgE family stress response membrane protein [Anaerolineaceae bacterium]